jgi:hypothetical protein
MPDHATPFLFLSILALATILLVFGMKYFSAAKHAPAGAASENAWRDIAAKAEAAQASSAAALAALQADVTDVKGKLASIEKVLREVA